MQAQQFGECEGFRDLEPMVFDETSAGGFAFFFRVDGKTRQLQVVHVTAGSTNIGVTLFGDLGSRQTMLATSSRLSIRHFIESWSPRIYAT